MLRALILALAFSLPIAAVANDNPPAAVVIKDIPTFLEHQQALRADMEKSKKFAHVDAASKRQLYAAQDQLFGVLKGKGSVEELNPDELVMVYNAQNEIAAILQNAEDDRPICEREEGVGSHFHTTNCTSKRQRDAARGAARDALQQPNKINNRAAAGAN